MIKASLLQWMIEPIVNQYAQQFPINARIIKHKNTSSLKLTYETNYLTKKNTTKKLFTQSLQS